MQRRLVVPVTQLSELTALSSGDLVYLSGTIYTARDQAHKRLIELMKAGKELPFDLKGSVIYYCGPTPPRADGLFGSAGPTTSGRMDEFTVPLYEAGLKATIGKGGRADKILQACRDFQAVYFITFGGAGAYLAKQIVEQELVAFPELGAEAIYRLKVVEFPVITAFDARGSSLIK